MIQTPILLLTILLILNLTQPMLGDNTELRALMEIKSSLDPQNKYLTTWDINGDPCSGSFQGIACNENGKVANISLQGRGLNGKLSPQIGKLKCLSGIYLHYNFISGEIPTQIGDLSELIDLYLNFNNFYGEIPLQISHMPSLQVLDLCCNHLTGSIPTQLGSLTKLNVLYLQYNQLTSNIPSSFGNLGMLKRLDLSYNQLSGPIPASLANIQDLRFLDVRNNSLSGAIPNGLKRLEDGFSYGNNTSLCGTQFVGLRACTIFDNGNVDINSPQPFGLILKNHSAPRANHPKTSNAESNCTNSTCSNNNNKKKVHQVVIVVGVITTSITLVAIAGFLIFFKHRRQKQKIGTTIEVSESRFSTDHVIDIHSRTNSPLVSTPYSKGWDPLGGSLNEGELSPQVLQSFRYNLEEVESATQYFSEANVMGKGNFSTVYKGVLRDGSIVSIKSISVTSCKSEEAEFVKGLKLLVLLRHENLVNLRGFCCSRGRGECFLIYDFAPNGSLLKYLDVGGGSTRVLDWSVRVSIITGIAKGLHYLHEENEGKPMVIHQSISAEKILLDQRYNPLILDSGIHKILADDIIFSALKVSAAMGYLAPEYITTGKFTEKSDVYAFGVIVLHILSGKPQLTNTMRSSAESCKLEDFLDPNLKGSYSISEASNIVRLGLICTHEFPDQRPNMEVVVQELNRCCSSP